MPDREKVIKESEEAIDILAKAEEPTFWMDFVRCAFENALDLLKEQYALASVKELRLYTAEEMRHLPDRTTVCIEMLISSEDEERGYITGCGWGVVWNSTGAADGGTIVGGLLGSFFPNTIMEIPFRALITTSDGERKVRLYRFWTDRPTKEQSKAVKWE